MTLSELVNRCETAECYAEAYAYATTDQEREDVLMAVRDADLSVIERLLKIAIEAETDNQE